MSLLKPEVSLGVALATGAIVAGVYFNALPPMADVRVAPAGNRHVNASRKAAAWTSAGVTAAISLIAKDPTVFTVGAALTIGLDWWYRHADSIDPRSGAIASLSRTAGNVLPVENSTPAPQFVDEDVFAY